METHKLVNLEYTNIEVMLPSIDFFLEKIKNDEIFHFYKVNHGMIDSIYSAYKGKYNELETDLLEKNYEKISKNIQLYGFKNSDLLQFSLVNIEILINKNLIEKKLIKPVYLS